MTTAKPPFRADHVGSLLRPQRLHDARAKAASGAISKADLTAVEDECISEVVRMQEEVGLQGATDGEFRRTTWHYDFLCGLEGIEQGGAHQGPAFGDGGKIASLKTSAKVANPNGVMLDHFRYLKSASNVTPKFCIPSPSLAYHRGGRDLIDKSVYPDVDEFWQDIADAYRAELHMLYAEGCRYLQLDDTTFAMLCDPKMREFMTGRGDDPSELVLTYSSVIADILKAKPADLTVTMHMCRGNMKSAWLTEGGYEPVAEAMFANVPVDGFFMEWDTDRAGDFEPLRFAPKDRKIILGLVSSKLPELESKDDLKRRVSEAAKFVPLENLCLSPQCGFASTVEGNLLSQDDQRRKLALVVETAHDVWGSG